MEIQEKLRIIINRQSEGVLLDDIANELNTSSKAIRDFMRRRGYTCKKGVFYLKEESSNTEQSNIQTIQQEQLTLGVSVTSNITQGKDTQTTSKTKNNTEDLVTKKIDKKKVDTKDSVDIDDAIVKFIIAAKATKKGSVYELTPETDDMVREMIDWKREVENSPKLKTKVTKKTTSVILNEGLLNEVINKRIPLDEGLFEEMLRLSSNVEIDVNMLIAQAMKNLLDTYRHLV